jgi:hypothetical protein
VVACDLSLTAGVEEITRVDLSLREDGALLLEWLRGFDLWDFVRRYRDTTEWYEVSLQVRGQRVPFFSVGQYVPREPLSTWYFELQARTLARLGLFRSARDAAVEAMERLKDAMSL